MDITDKVKAEIENSEVEIQTVTALSKLIENRDLSTKEHSVGVRNLAVKIGQKLNFTLEQLEELSIAATLHDIGKIGIPENVLNKPDKLTEDEYELIKEHSKIGYEALNEINRLKNVAKYILHHHEKYDGTGYPSQQVGCEIPLASRVLAIADVYEAITSDRVYRKAMTKEQGIEIMANGKGSHFDPELLKIFFAILEEDKEIKK
jgi:putative nucleotidyltransferase with HDIG domain